ncbi:unnamed protein product [Prorocentrum cordatum]|uniref:Uncharacterized protein n=1 Tax=Prorocentrum cordatum TaxID=2364126 RepID=A0ABN9V319_9DINO|nr:unnamed protein product [Polarella glacialis]
MRYSQLHMVGFFVRLIGYFGRDPGLAVSVRFGNPIIAGRWLHHSVPRQPPGDPPVGRIRRPLGLCRAEPQDSLTFSRLPETKGLFTGISKLRPGNKFTSPELLPRIELTSDSAMSNHTSDSESTSDLFEDSPKFSKAGMIFHRTSGIASEDEYEEHAFDQGLQGSADRAGVTASPQERFASGFGSQWVFGAVGSRRAGIIRLNQQAG